MRIGFDAKRLFNNKTGLGNYSRTLVHNLIKYHPNHSYYLYSPKIVENSETEFFLKQKNIRIISNEKGSDSAWRSKGILKDIKRDQLDIFHGLSNELPFGISKLKTKAIATIHDVIFERYPKQYGFFDRKVYRFKTKNAILQADQIISISQQTSEDLIQFYQAPKEKLNTLYQTCNPYFTDQPVNPSVQQKDYFLYVGSIIERKNLLNILKAMKLIPATDRKKLIIVGSGGKYFRQVKAYAEETKLNDWLEWKGNMNNSELKNLYQNAIALIYPSIFEGFGIPVIESMYAGRPVITSDLSSLKEAGGHASLLIDPFDINQLVEAMNNICNPNIQKSYIEKIPKHLSGFHPKRLSDRLMEIYLS